MSETEQAAAFVTTADSAIRQNVAAGKETVMQMLIGPDQAPHFAMRRFIMEPGGGMPLHTNSVEHEQFVLRGQASIVIGEETFEVKSGDVVFIPGGVPHSYEAQGNEPFEFLCLVPNGPDQIALVDPAC